MCINYVYAIESRMENIGARGNCIQLKSSYAVEPAPLIAAKISGV